MAATTSVSMFIIIVTNSYRPYKQNQDKGRERRTEKKRERGCKGHSRSLSPGLSKSMGARGGKGWSHSPGCPTLSPPFLLLLLFLTGAQLLSDSSSASRSQVKKAVTDLRATPLPCCSAGSLLDSHL